MVQFPPPPYASGGRRSLDFVRLRFTRVHPSEPELPYAIKYFLKHNSYRTECFLKQWICIEHWI